MNISLPDGMDRWITEKVRSGQYASTSEVIRDGVRSLQRQEELRESLVRDLRQELLIGLRQLDEGKTSRFDDDLVERVKRRGREQLGR